MKMYSTPAGFADRLKYPSIVKPFFEEIADMTLGSLVVRNARVRVDPSAEQNAMLPLVDAAQPLKCSDVSGFFTVGAEASAAGQ